jgi:peptide/nickel transport system permease protein
VSRLETRQRVGIVILAVIVAIALFGPLIAPYSPTDAEPPHYMINDEGRRVPVRPPYPPSASHWLGTNENGYDLLSQMLYGARYSVGFILTVSGLRLVMAIVIASAGHLLRHQRARWEPRPLPRTGIGAAVPEFVVAYTAMLGIAFNPPAPPLGMAVIQAAMLSLIGLPGLVPAVRARIEWAASQTFVEAQIASGADARHVYRETVLPSLAGEFRLLFAHEALLVAVVLGELAIFAIFVGGTRQYFDPPEFYTRTYEWAGMLGAYRDELLGGTARLALVPLAGYLLLMAGLWLVSSPRSMGRIAHRHSGK